MNSIKNQIKLLYQLNIFENFNGFKVYIINCYTYQTPFITNDYINRYKQPICKDILKITHLRFILVEVTALQY
jgi:hypothetical protein